MQSNVGHPVDYNVELKIDGLALSLIYENGKPRSRLNTW